ncbi:Hpt domain-containing protein [Limimaricola pyoseonensis]|uniref:Hpt domain-containing protein n=1 Tax=Limimaricola pyoseonensis TaxID=521013 RepID=A0A1G7JJB9_9RHOB|nr:Hpt domain-containing protein [Limimaricola pyoseonensis]SDF24874.1 Hpt domain-containing protein [Limimaricola pyoseonensis]
MTDYADRVRQIRERFLTGLEDRLEAINTTISRLEQGEPGAVDDLHLSLHDLTGNAAMLGLDDMAAESRRGLAMLEEGRLETGADDPAALADIRASVARLYELKT